MLLTLLRVAIGPVIALPDRLPGYLLTISYASPATYAASAMRQTLIGPLSPRLALDLTALTGFTLLFFWLTARRMDWREQ